MQREPDASDQRRLEAARQTVWAVAAAFKSIRLYSPGHTLVQKAIDHAVTVLKSYGDRFGSLVFTVVPRGVVVESSPQPVEDEVVNELARALRMGFVRSVRILGGMSAREINAFLNILQMPQQQIRNSGGVSRLLRDQGIDSLAVEDLGEAEEEAVAAAGIPALLQAIPAGPQAVGMQLLAVADGDPNTALQLLRELDRKLGLRPWPDQEAAHRIVAQALLGTTRFHQALQVEVVRALDEPFAISIASQWPPLMLEELARAGGQDRSGGLDAVVQALGQTTQEIRPGRISLEAVARPEILQARAALVSSTRELRPHGLRRMIDSLPALEARKFEACLAAIERECAEMESVEHLVSILAELGVLTRRLDNGRSELARAALHRILTTQVRDRLATTLGQNIEAGHPLEVLAREAPDEAVLLLLELVAEESRLHVRREIVAQLQTLARGRIQLLTAQLVDPRWYIVRNVVTVLGSTGQPEAVPYLRVALSHADVRVRKEALHALAQIRAPEAVRLMTEALAYPDAETQQAAAHWLGMTDSPEAAQALIALLHTSSMHEAVDLKRAAIRSLGRLGTPEAEAELERIQSLGGLFARRQISDLKTEAAKALMSLREARS
ncbi:MAG: HEAT repeat domain-containing protein [bacterium]